MSAEPDPAAVDTRGGAAAGGHGNSAAAGGHGNSAAAGGHGEPGGDLAARQAALVAALVAGGPPPPGFDADRLAVAREALLRKRAGEVAAAWPLLAAAFGTGWPARFAGWATGRPPAGSLRDGWDLARELAAAGELPATAAPELAEREAGWHYDGAGPPRRRRGPALRRVAGVAALQVAGRVRLFAAGGRAVD